MYMISLLIKGGIIYNRYHQANREDAESRIVGWMLQSVYKFVVMSIPEFQSPQNGCPTKMRCTGILSVGFVLAFVLFWSLSLPAGRERRAYRAMPLYVQLRASENQDRTNEGRVVKKKGGIHSSRSASAHFFSLLPKGA